MRYKCLRVFMKKNNMSTPYNYANKPLVIDGNSLRDLYKISGCQFILGGEYDRFASSVKNILSVYIKSGIKCYVVFNGAAKTDMETRKHIQQTIINKTDAIIPGGTYVYCEPIFVKDLLRDVLNELEIKHYTCMYNWREVLFSLAKELKCPILTNNFEYALYGVSVISLRSVVFNEATQSISCSIYFDYRCRQWFDCSNNLMSVMLTATDEDSSFYNELLDMFSLRPGNNISSMIYWIRQNNYISTVKYIKCHLKEENRQVFMETVAELRRLFNNYPHSLVMEYLINGRPTEDQKEGFEEMSDEEFEYHVGVGRIAIPFINLKTFGILSGTWVVYNKSREDAMLVATDIALYAQALLTNSQEVKTKFIGRKHDVCDISVIEKIINIQQKRIKQENSESIDHFLNFIKEHLIGFDLRLLEPVSEDSWILLISLLYYNQKAKKDITNVAYSIILSYVLLSPVSEKVGVIERSNFSVNNRETREDSGETEDKINTSKTSLTYEQCSKTAAAVMDLFDVQESALKDNFDRDALHTLAEFQHCLQFMNYLNRLCGEKIKCTKYQKAINCTFIYNIFVALEDENVSGDYIEKLLNCPPAYKYFKNILDTYFRCLSLLNCN